MSYQIEIIPHKLGSRKDLPKAMRGSRMIPILDLKARYESIKDEINAAMADALESTQFIGEGSLPVSEAASQEVLSLPVYPELTEEQQVMVAEAIRGFYGLRRTTNPSALRQRSGQAWLRTGVGRSLDTDDG